MIVRRPISRICRELAESARLDHHDVLAQILRMAALEATENGARHEDRDSHIRDLLVGTWDWDIANDLVYADARFARLFGISAEQAARGTPLKVWLNAIHPDDVDDVRDDINQSVATGKLFSREYRIVADGEICWVYARGKCTQDQTGKAVRFPGAIVDITREKTNDRQFSIAPT